MRGSLVVASLILSASLASAQESATPPPSRLLVPASVFAFTQGLDVHSTHAAIAAGGQEANPIMNIGTAGRIVLKAAGTAAIIWTARRLEKKGHGKMARAALFVGAGVTAVIAARNYGIAQQAR